MKKFILIIIFLLFISAPVYSQVIELSSTRSKVEKTGFTAEIYKPSRLLIGESTKFILRAEPGSKVSLALSEQGHGSTPIMGKELRLGKIVNAVETQVGENGVVEIEVELPEKDEFVGKVMYFEALVWKKRDFSDLQLAKIVGTSGRETNNNAVLIAAPVKGSHLPTLGPAIPGIGNLNNAIDAVGGIKRSEEEDNSDYLEHMNQHNQPLIMRNLRVPE